MVSSRWWLIPVLVAACGGPGGGKQTGTGPKPAPETGGPPAGGPKPESVPVGTGSQGTDPTSMPSPSPAPAASKDPEWDAAVAFFAKQENNGCEEAADKFISAGKNSPKGYFNAGVAMQRCGKPADAERYYKKALDLNPKYAPALATMGELRFKEGKTSEAQALFQQAVDNDANAEVTSARIHLAWMLYQQMRTSTPAQRAPLEATALGHLQRVLAIDNDNVVAYTNMALIYMEGSDKNRNRLDVADLLISEGKKRNDKYAPLWNASGILKIKKGSVAKALEDFRTAVTLDPKLAEARMNVGQIVLSSRDYKEAETQFREVLKLVKKSYEATIGLGVALRGEATVARSLGQQAEFDAKINEAEETYKKAVEMDGNRPDAYYNLGLLYKDYRTNNADQKQNVAQYKRARQYFQDFLARADKADGKRDDAQGHIQDCDKYVAILSKI